jgi:hypothetical protein
MAVTERVPHRLAGGHIGFPAAALGDAAPDPPDIYQAAVAQNTLTRRAPYKGGKAKAHSAEASGFPDERLASAPVCT